MTHRHLTAVTAAVVAFALAPAWGRAVDVPATIAGLTWARRDVGSTAAEALLEGGPAALGKLVALLRVPGEGDDANVRFAFEALAIRVTGGEHEAERQMVTRAWVAGLGARTEPTVRAFLTRQLRVVGDASAVPALAPMLGDPDLRDPAIAALQSIGGPEAATALLQALNGAEGGSRTALVLALGHLRSRESVPAVLPLATDPDPALRRAAWFALANTGATEGLPVFAAALTGSDVAQRNLALRMGLLTADRLAEAGQVDVARAAWEAILTVPRRPRQGHVAAGALAGLTTHLGVDALPHLLAAVGDADVTVREAAVKLLEELDDDAVTDAVAQRAAGAPDAAIRASLIASLGRRGDPDGLPVVKAALADADAGARHAAIRAMTGFSQETVLPILTGVLATEDDGDIAVVEEVLLQLTHPALAPTVAAGIPQASAGGRRALLAVLAARGARDQVAAVIAATRDGDRGVRVAALRALERTAGAAQAGTLVDQLINAPGDAELNAARKTLVTLARQFPAVEDRLLATTLEAKGETRALLLAALGRLGGAEALAATTADTTSPDAVVKDAAVRALAGWPDRAATGALLTVYRESTDRIHQVLSLKGYLRLGVEGPPAEAATRMRQAWDAARDDGDRKLILGAVGNVRHADALGLVTAALELETLREEAAAAAVRMVCPRDKNDAGMTTPAAFELMRKVVAASKTDAFVKKAGAHLESAPPTSTANLALNRPVTISCKQQGPQKPQFAVDGNLSNQQAYWGDRWPSWLQVDLGQTATIDTVRFIPYWDGNRFYTYNLQVSTEGKAWKTVVDRANNKTVSRPQGFVHRFDPVEARYVRVNMLRNSVNEAVHIVELEVYAEGKAPKTLPSELPPEPPPPPPLPEPDAEGFISLFNGRDLTGWVGTLQGYEVRDGILASNPKSSGTILTAHQFGDFILRFQFKLTAGANNGLALRAPRQGNPAYAGMELQILDNTAEKYAKLQPYQYHGSIYGVVPAKRGFLKPVGEWNTQEVRAIGGRITVVLNGETITDANVWELEETADGGGRARHPGMLRHRGHLGFMGHGAHVEFRELKIKPLPPYSQGPHNVPPKGFTALFNGTDLTGWKGLVANPEKRAAMTEQQLADARKKADEVMRSHWKVEDDALVFSGHGSHLCTIKDYADFEMLVDWKIEPGGDSGIYLRGSPQVQIWDTAKWPEGSGGLYNNQRNPRKPMLCADNPIGQWNRFRIRMVEEKVTVWLNGELVVDDVTMENYWNRKKPIYPSGQLELQSHGSKLYFRNVFVRELEPQ